MKQSIFIFSLTLFASFSIGLWSQKKIKMADIKMNDAKAGKILSDVKQKISSYKSYKINFSFELHDPNDKQHQPQSCTYSFKNGKFKLAMHDKMVWCDGKTIWSYMVKNKEVQINHYKESQQYESPVNLVQNYEKEYYYHFKDETTTKPNQKLIELTPIDKKKSIFKIDVLIDTDKKKLLYAKFYEKSGVRQIFTINQILENPDLSESEFVMQQTFVPKDTEIIDLR